MSVQFNMGDVLKVKKWALRNCFRMACWGIAFGLGFTGSALAEGAGMAATQTALQVSTDNAGPQTKVTLTAHVTSTGGAEAPGGVVNFRSGADDLGSAVVDEQGEATLTTSNLAAGSHQVAAVYQGDAAHAASISPTSQVNAQASSAAGFDIAASPTSLKVAAGAFVSSVLTVTPTAPFNAYVSLSCSGLPVSSTCTFSPNNVLASCVAGAGNQEVCTAGYSTMQIQTLGPGGGKTMSSQPGRQRMPAYAFAVPALFGLAGLGVRKNRAMLNVVLLFLLLAGALALSSCKEQYNYLNHGPTPNPGTPTGTYTVTIDAVSTTGSLITRPATAPQLTLTVTGGS